MGQHGHRDPDVCQGAAAGVSQSKNVVLGGGAGLGAPGVRAGAHVGNTEL